jgi:hypothetical protein
MRGADDLDWSDPTTFQAAARVATRVSVATSSVKTLDLDVVGPIRQP